MTRPDGTVERWMIEGGTPNILFLSSAYIAGSRAIRLTRVGGTTEVEELWFSSRLRFMFLNGIRVGDYVYGTSGDFGPAFMTAIDVRTGEDRVAENGASGDPACSTPMRSSSSWTRMATSRWRRCRRNG